MTELKNLKQKDLFMYYTKKDDMKSLQYFGLFSPILWGVVLGQSGSKTEVVTFADPFHVNTPTPIYCVRFVNNRVKVDESDDLDKFFLRRAIENTFEFENIESYR